MKILILPLLMSLVPVFLWYFILHFLKEIYASKLYIRIVLFSLTLLVGLLASWISFFMSLEGMGEKGIKCTNGVLLFLISEVFINLVAVPQLLFYKNYKNKD